MNLFLVLSNAPDPSGEAIEVVGHEVIAKASALGHHVAVQVLLRDPRRGESAEHAESRLRQLNLPNVHCCPTLYVEDVIERRDRRTLPARVMRMLTSLTISRLFPASALGPTVEERVRDFRADAIVSIWSWESLAAIYRIAAVPKFVYYGNPDHLPPQARYRNPDLFGIPRASLRDRLFFLFLQLENRRRKALNVKMMKACEITANNSVLDAQFYAEQGHPRSIYLQNMWPADESGGRHDSPHGASRDPVRIIGSVGNLGATGNTFALHYLGRELLPRLSDRLQGRQLEIHLFGKGKVSPSVAPYLRDSCIKFRGWVDDIKAEFRSATAFLVLTNVSPDFLVGNTRILLAWSLRTCVIMHANSRLAMPEIEHGKNALLGHTPEEIAEWIAAVVEDDTLRARIGEGGRATFEAHYRSDMVVPSMLRLVDEMVQQFRTGTRDREAAPHATGKTRPDVVQVEQRHVH